MFACGELAGRIRVQFIDRINLSWRTPMRYAHMTVLLASAVALSACATQQRTKETAPTVTYEYNDQDEYDVIAEKADLYCEEEYGRDADLVDRDKEDNGYEATFACK
jgi:hypothetical protein